MYSDKKNFIGEEKVSCAVWIIVDLDPLDLESVASVTVFPRRELCVPVDLIHRLKQESLENLYRVKFKIIQNKDKIPEGTG